MRDRTSSGYRQKRPKHSFFAETFLRLVREKPLATFGGVLVVLLFFTGIFANVLAPYGMNEIHLQDALSPPSATHWLGTDKMGRDMLSRCIFGARISMVVGLGAGFLCVLIACLIGITSGFFGGKVDLLLQRFIDAIMCFPAMFIILAFMGIVGPGLVHLIVVLGVIRGILNSRVVRSAVISVRESRYIDAAIAIGCKTSYCIVRHVLPNVLAPVIIISTVEMGYMIIAEASISFLGFGIPPPYPSWGGMLSGQGRGYMLQSPWLAVWPGLFLSLAVFGINMFSDGLRDILDPRLKGRMGVFRASRRKKQELSNQMVMDKGRLNKA